MRARVPSAATLRSVPTTSETENAAWCRTPRRSGLGAADKVEGGTVTPER
jgi:hypothetical protein